VNWPWKYLSSCHIFLQVLIQNPTKHHAHSLWDAIECTTGPKNFHWIVLILFIEDQQKNPTEANLDSHRTKVEQALVSTTSELEKPMDIDHNEHKKCACIPNNVSIKEPNPGSTDTGTPEQKHLKNDDTTSVAMAVNCKLFPELKATEIQEHLQHQQWRWYRLLYFLQWCPRL